VTDLEHRLAMRTLELVDIPSVSREEAALHAHVLKLIPRPPFEVEYLTEDAMLLVTPRREGRPFVILAGHLDTIPPQGNFPGRREGGSVHGLGATDMKSGLAVMIEIARWLAAEEVELEVDLGLLFFAREELAQSESPLPAFFAACERAREADLAIVMEPTDNTVQAGCLGNINADLVFHGEAAHSARPWTGVNAIARAVEGLAHITSLPREEVVVAGLPFYEVLSVTRFAGGVADNVIPELASARLNYRYAPDKTREQAEARLRALAAPAGGELTVLSNSSPARVAAGTALVKRLCAAGGYEILPKQAWTPVAEFSDAGLDAVNLGPGATRYAHRRDEQVETAELVRTFKAVARFLTEPA
jgi:succinyl-diaminopimelate desuccinylase